ncbi:MarR family winged helix-turn-helix transcriptional regulator [Neolewinella agarilytica]|uniref:DNA-binding transcriptional regulator, MarR family n=1 Tax=Neolewinella agarilytica TaxID=478744 RepID=A0A1H8ZK68_9BACT|nr:MarR family transcriptional regulator [Neolewinella agarilytica]SEP64663.1 DNA-binding transcriptional regulator, MarR family [Neolewinella agarilytica]
MNSIEEAIQQPKFETSSHRAQVNIIYTAAWLNHGTIKALKPYGLSLQQFNIMRILRGRGGQPSTIKLLTERMLDKMSNASRLVDKLKEKGYVERKECAEDRRRVDILITEAGLDVIERASQAVERSRSSSFNTLTDEEANQLSHLLDKLRGA